MVKNRVLIIDDDQRICRLIKRVADGLGINSLAIDNPEHFESVYLDFKPNVILMDLQMPKLDGVELLRKLADQQSPAAILLASGMDKSVIETTTNLGKSLGLNMAGVLNKPMDIDDIKEILGKQFSMAKRRSADPAELTEVELEKAIERDEFLVYYQPQLLLESGKLIGVEALVRWQHPEHGLVFPDSFIPLAVSREDLIGPLTYKVLEIALRDDKVRCEQGIKLNISINLSAKLLSDLSFPDKVQSLLTSYSFDPNRLILEVTESVAMENPSLTMDILARLRLKNIRLSLDDFGTGFSSLVQLYRMPFTEIKVDKSFVMKASTDKEAATISRITINLGHSLGLEVVAEGIEDKETYEWLKDLGCEIGQGYFIGRPVDLGQFCEWANCHNRKQLN